MVNKKIFTPVQSQMIYIFFSLHTFPNYIKKSNKIKENNYGSKFKLYVQYYQAIMQSIQDVPYI